MNKNIFIRSAGGLGEPARPTAAPFIREEVDESPDWLKSLTQESQTPTGQAEASAPAAPLFPADQAAPNWLSTLGSASEQVPGITVPAFVTDEQGELGGEVAEPFIAPESDEYLSSTPDWLSQVTADDAVTASQAQSEGETEEIARADLPTWLEAMPPVEAVAPEMFTDMSDSRVESVGPLAGLRCTLPAGLDIKDTLKPPPYSLKLAVHDDLQARLDVLTGLRRTKSAWRPERPACARV